MDIARGIAMLCIIMGHFGIATVNRFVYSFHVPFFFLLNGYFYSQRGTWKEFILTKAKQLLIPYAIGVVGIMVATSICFPLLGYSLLDLALRLKYILKAGILGAGTLHMVPFEIHQIGALWFLLALFFGNIILRFALQTKVPFLVVAVSALAAWASPRFIWLPFSIQRVCLRPYICIWVTLQSRKAFFRNRLVGGWLLHLLFCGRFAFGCISA